MKIFVGIPSYNRGKIFSYCLKSFTRTKLIKGFILVVDASSDREKEFYVQSLKELIEKGFEIIDDVKIGRRGSTKARNMVLEYARYNLRKDDILVLYDDDYIYQEIIRLYQLFTGLKILR